MVYNRTMDIKFDLHTHTLASGHHTADTLTMMAERAKNLGFSYLGITDHAPKMQGSATVSYFRNLKYADKKLYGVNILYGAELNVITTDGDIDLPWDVLESLDFCLASLHQKTFPPKDKEKNTTALINAMKNPYVFGICHPDDPIYSIDEEALVHYAKETGTLLEVSSVGITPDGYRKQNVEWLIKMLLECKRKGAYVFLGSDSHGQENIGNFKNSLKLLEMIDFPKKLVVNYDEDLFFYLLNKKQNF